MKDTDNAPLQIQREQGVDQRLQVMFFLCSRHQIHKDLPRRVPSPKEQMAQIACMLHFPIIADISLPKIFQHADKNLIHILMDQFTVRGSEHIICTPFFMKS